MQDELGGKAQDPQDSRHAAAPALVVLGSTCRVRDGTEQTSVPPCIVGDEIQAKTTLDRSLLVVSVYGVM